jgi:DDE superfamily endonuclease
MEDVLDLYAEAHDPKRPVVCFDESPTQLIGEVRQPIRAKPGQPRRYDYEYKRNGTVNLFVFLDAHRPWRKVKVTDSRTAVDFAACMRDLTDVHYPKAERIRVVLDNLSTHSAGALYEAFPACEARRVLDLLEFHYVPSTPAGSTWSRSKSACSAANASTAGSALASASNPKSSPGIDSEMQHAPVSNGCSPSTRPAQKWAAPILVTPIFDAPNSKSHNHCARVLVDLTVRMRVPQ